MICIQEKIDDLIKAREEAVFALSETLSEPHDYDGDWCYDHECSRHGSWWFGGHKIKGYLLFIRPCKKWQQIKVMNPKTNKKYFIDVCDIIEVGELIDP